MALEILIIRKPRPTLGLSTSDLNHFFRVERLIRLTLLFLFNKTSRYVFRALLQDLTKALVLPDELFCQEFFFAQRTNYFT